MIRIPFIGWLFDLCLKITLSIPFWFIWTVCGLGKKYFFFLPEQFQSIPFWHCVGLFMAIPILLLIITPQFATVEQKVKQKVEKDTTKESKTF
jgi:hypothetical protein